MHGGRQTAVQASPLTVQMSEHRHHSSMRHQPGLICAHVTHMQQPASSHLTPAHVLLLIPAGPSSTAAAAVHHHPPRGCTPWAVPPGAASEAALHGWCCWRGCSQTAARVTTMQGFAPSQTTWIHTLMCGNERWAEHTCCMPACCIHGPHPLGRGLHCMQMQSHRTVQPSSHKEVRPFDWVPQAPAHPVLPCVYSRPWRSPGQGALAR